MLRFSKNGISHYPTKETMAKRIYAKLGDKTENHNVVIKRVYQDNGVKHARKIRGVFSLRLRNSNTHFGNPFSSVDRLVKKDGLRKVATTKESVVKYIDWVIYSTDERAKWIRRVLNSKQLVGKPVIYYKELNEPSHATALGYLIANWEECKEKW